MLQLQNGGDMLSNQVHQGMGAIVHKDGVAFRVWAPNAQSVYVKGDFNDWSDTATPLSHEENGYWYTDVASAKPGDEYKYVLINGDQQFDRIDPYARQVTNSTGNGVIYDACVLIGKTTILSCRRTMNWSSMRCISVHFLRPYRGNPGILILQSRKSSI
jgi:hypothetical protein